jgi:two-component system chemotaxis response regulator CheB
VAHVAGPAAIRPFFVVGVAASAGSVPPLMALAPALPTTLEIAVLLAYHQGDQHPSQLVEILRRRSLMQVRNAVDGERLRPGLILSVAAHRHLVVLPGWRLSTPLEEPIRFVRPSADRLFESLARVCGPHAIALVLSGSGSDGARGIRAVKAAGGTVVVQNSATAGFRGMPDAAIRTGLADLVLPVEEIGPALRQLTRGSLN